jgi:hypothetical protein
VSRSLASALGKASALRPGLSQTPPKLFESV